MDPKRLRAVLAANIRRAAHRKGMSLTSLADFAAVSRAQLFDVLGARKSPTIDWLAKIAGPLGARPSDLLTERDDSAGLEHAEERDRS